MLHLRPVLPLLGISDQWLDISHQCVSLIPFLKPPPPVWVRVGCDNLGVVYNLLHGSSHTDAINTVIPDIFQLAAQYNLRFNFYHIPGVLNTEADSNSRMPIEDGWVLADSAFTHISGQYGPFSIDACASPPNAICPRFISRFATPGAYFS